MKKLATCLNCSCSFSFDEYSSQGKYCSNKCQQQYQTAIAVETGKGTHGKLRTYLIQKFGAKCFICGWDEINPITKKCPIELDHIDGNSLNNAAENGRLLCPNCHSLSPTYKALNKGNGRHKRMKRYQEGKSF